MILTANPQKKAVQLRADLINPDSNGGYCLMSEYFSFQKCITSPFVKTVYFLGFLALTAGGIGLSGWAGMRLYEASIPRGLGWYYIAGGIGILLVGNLVWRVFCEIWIVLFNIY